MLFESLVENYVLNNQNIKLSKKWYAYRMPESFVI